MYGPKGPPLRGPEICEYNANLQISPLYCYHAFQILNILEVDE